MLLESVVREKSTYLSSRSASRAFTPGFRSPHQVEDAPIRRLPCPESRQAADSSSVGHLPVPRGSASSFEHGRNTWQSGVSQVPEPEGIEREEQSVREETTYLRTWRQAKIKNTRAFAIIAGCGPPPSPRLRAGRSFMSWFKLSPSPEPRITRSDGRTLVRVQGRRWTHWTLR